MNSNCIINKLDNIEWPTRHSPHFYEKLDNIFNKLGVILPSNKEDTSNKCNQNENTKFECYHELISSYLSPTSPYRSLMLYHSIGSGKTLTSFKVISNFIDKKDFTIYFVCPPGLVSYVSNEINKFRNILPKSFKHKFYRISYISFANRLSGKTKWEIGPHKGKLIKDNSDNRLLENSLVVIDEVHNIHSNDTAIKNAFNIIYKSIRQCKNIKILTLTGTPIKREPYEIGRVINLLKSNDSRDDLPEDKTTFNETYFIVDDTTQIPTLRKDNIGEFFNSIKGYISFRNIENDYNIFAKKIDMDKQIVTMSNLQSKQYNKNISNCDNNKCLQNSRISNIVNGYQIPKEFRKIMDNLNKYSPKLELLYQNIEKHQQSKHFIYSYHQAHGVRIVKELLLYKGWKQIDRRIISKCFKNGNDIFKNDFKLEMNLDFIDEFMRFSKNNFLVLDSYTSSKKIEILAQQLYNLPINKNGDFIRIFLVNRRYKEGISLLDTNYVHILEPPINMSDKNQIIGRVIRYCSHNRLPFPNKWFVKVYVYYSTFTNDNTLETEKRQQRKEMDKQLPHIESKKVESKKVESKKVESKKVLDKELQEIELDRELRERERKKELDRELQEKELDRELRERELDRQLKEREMDKELKDRELEKKLKERQLKQEIERELKERELQERERKIQLEKEIEKELERKKELERIKEVEKKLKEKELELEKEKELYDVGDNLISDTEEDIYDIDENDKEYSGGSKTNNNIEILNEIDCDSNDLYQYNKEKNRCQLISTDFAFNKIANRDYGLLESINNILKQSAIDCLVYKYSNNPNMQCSIGQPVVEEYISNTMVDDNSNCEKIITYKQCQQNPTCYWNPLTNMRGATKYKPSYCNTKDSNKIYCSDFNENKSLCIENNCSWNDSNNIGENNCRDILFEKLNNYSNGILLESPEQYIISSLNDITQNVVIEQLKEIELLIPTISNYSQIKEIITVLSFIVIHYSNIDEPVLAIISKIEEIHSYYIDNDIDKLIYNINQYLYYGNKFTIDTTIINKKYPNIIAKKHYFTVELENQKILLPMNFRFKINIDDTILYIDSSKLLGGTVKNIYDDLAIIQFYNNDYHFTIQLVMKKGLLTQLYLELYSNTKNMYYLSITPLDITKKYISTPANKDNQIKKISKEKKYSIKKPNTTSQNKVVEDMLKKYSIKKQKTITKEQAKSTSKTKKSNQIVEDILRKYSIKQNSKTKKPNKWWNIFQ